MQVQGLNDFSPEDSLEANVQKMAENRFAVTMHNLDWLRHQLWAIKNLCTMDIRATEDHGIMEISHRKDNRPVRVDTNMEDLMTTAMEQNFVPVVDDRNTFIGIVTRKAIMQYFLKHYVCPEGRTAQRQPSLAR